MPKAAAGPDEARAGVRAGQLRSLDEIIGELQAPFGGRLLRQELPKRAAVECITFAWIDS